MIFLDSVRDMKIYLLVSFEVNSLPQNILLLLKFKSVHYLVCPKAKIVLSPKANLSFWIVGVVLENLI